MTRKLFEATMTDAMMNWGMAETEKEAHAQIDAHKGEDLAGITNSFKAGLQSLCEQMGIEFPHSESIQDAKLSVEFKEAMKHAAITVNLAEGVTFLTTYLLTACQAIHDQWVVDNISRLVEKSQCGKAGQYRPLELIGFDEVVSDLLFMKAVCKESEVTINDEELRTAYDNRVKKFDRGNGYDVFSGALSREVQTLLAAPAPQYEKAIEMLRAAMENEL